MTKYLNLDKLVPEEQVLEIGGRKFDVSKVPARKTVNLIKVNAESGGDQYESYIAELKALMDVLGEDQDGKPIDLEWVLDNVSNAQLKAIIEFITECIGGDSGDVAEGETPGNFRAAKAAK